MLYRIKLNGRYAGKELKVNRYGQLQAVGFKATTLLIAANIYKDYEHDLIVRDMLRLAEFVNASINSIELERVA